MTMIDKNIFKDILPLKKYLYLAVLSDFVQAVLLAGASCITAYLAGRLLYAQLSFEAAAPFLALLFFFLTAKAVLAHCNQIKIEEISLKVQSRLRLMLLSALSRRRELPGRYAEGQWLALVTRGVDRLDAYITGFLPQLSALAVFPPVLLACAFYSDWISGAIFLGTAPLIPLFMILIGKLADKENKRQWQVFQRLTSYMADLLPGLLVLKAYNQAERQLAQMEQRGRDFSTATLKVLRIAFLSAFMLEFITTLSIAVIAVNIGLRLIYGEAQFVPVFFMLLLAPQFYLPFRRFGASFHEAMNGITAASEIYGLQAQLAELNDENTANAKPVKKWDAAPEVQFQDVYFSYENGGGLRGLSFTAPAGRQTVITGPNGAGKSTAFKLILNLLQPDSGRISADGADMSRLSAAERRQLIGWAAQEPYLFFASVRDNITMGRPCSEAQLRRTAEQVNLAAFIESLPEGYDTMIGGSTKLSAGQMRRLGLARALFSEPRLLLLDEPMENLDRENEDDIQAILARLRGKTTVLIIAHRLHTIASADKIVMVENGCLTECGSPQELASSGGAYAQLLAQNRLGAASSAEDALKKEGECDE